MQSLSSILSTFIETDNPPVAHGTTESDVTMMLDKTTMCSPVSKQSPLSNLVERILHVFLLIFLSFIVLLFISAGFAFFEMEEVNRVTIDLDHRDKQIVQERLRANEFERQLQDLQVQSQRTIDQLNESLTDKNAERYPLIKYGKKFGVFLGSSFDDSNRSDFKHEHYFNGLTIGQVIDDLEAYKFRYTSDLLPTPISSDFHGEEIEPMRSEFYFQHRERIAGVEGLVMTKTIRLANGTNSSLVAVTGLRFCSMNDIWSLAYDGPKEGEEFSEHFPNYTLGYIKGRADRYLHQIQFVWYRTQDNH